ncbi:MAG: large-conductance mechanosensitive channel protein MscL [Alphaproteobacteria bacterium]
MTNGFKKFISRGNVVDMATGIIVGASFTSIVKSLVDDIISPPIGILLSGVDFKDLFILLKQGKTPPPYATLEAASEAGAVTINYGMFLSSIVSFLIVAIVVYFCIHKVVHMKKEVKKAAPPPQPSAEEVLLTEIRDILKKDGSS